MHRIGLSQKFLVVISLNIEIFFKNYFTITFWWITLQQGNAPARKLKTKSVNI